MKLSSIVMFVYATQVLLNEASGPLYKTGRVWLGSHTTSMAVGRPTCPALSTWTAINRVIEQAQSLGRRWARVGEKDCD